MSNIQSTVNMDTTPLSLVTPMTPVIPVTKKRIKKVLTDEEIAAKQKLIEEKNAKLLERQEASKAKKEEKDKIAAEKKKEKQKEKENKKKLQLQEELDKTNGFRVPSSKLFNRIDKSKLGFTISLYSIIEELAPELLKDIDIRIAFNLFVACLEKHKDNINLWYVAPKNKYTIFSTVYNVPSIENISKELLDAYYFNIINGYYYTKNISRYNVNKVNKESDDFKQHCNNIKEIYDSYKPLYDMIYPIIGPKAKNILTSQENARIVEQNKIRIKQYKDAIIHHRNEINKYKELLKKADIEATTYNELFEGDQ